MGCISRPFDSFLDVDYELAAHRRPPCSGTSSAVACRVPVTGAFEESPANHTHRAVGKIAPSGDPARKHFLQKLHHLDLILIVPVGASLEFTTGFGFFWLVSSFHDSCGRWRIVMSFLVLFCCWWLCTLELVYSNIIPLSWDSKIKQDDHWQRLCLLSCSLVVRSLNGLKSPKSGWDDSAWIFFLLPFVVPGTLSNRCVLCRHGLIRAQKVGCMFLRSCSVPASPFPGEPRSPMIPTIHNGRDPPPASAIE